jgi:hypothetical protein
MVRSVSSPARDLALLRRFEPSICYTRGERFFPIDVERYIQECSLWVHVPGQAERMLVPPGELTLEQLTKPRQEGFGAIHYVKFIDPMDLLDLARYSIEETVRSITHRDLPDVFYAGLGRLARVGYGSRLIDALFSFSLLLRGRVPGDTAAAAAQTYRRLQAQVERYQYYGRVVQQNGWIVLQYWFFYPFNNWRSGFFGVNDHEGDWEMICVYCSHDGEMNCVTPRWVAYASHDFTGDDLRRRWDDPEVEKVDDHPVVYAGAGSHASYFAAGEYLAELEISFLSPLARIGEKLQSVWVNTLRQGGVRREMAELNVFRVPFIDYARGDGLVIGPGRAKQWEACLLEPAPGWVQKYRGLWGLYANDPIAGENAPAGPMYNRDGTVRMSWYNPTGWAGLDKVPSPEEAQVILARQRTLALSHCDELRNAIAEKSQKLLGLGVEADAVQGFFHLKEIHQEIQARIHLLTQELDDLRRQLTEEETRLEAFQLHEARLTKGDPGAARTHIRRAHRPSSEVELRWSRLAEAFSAVSIGILIIGIVLLVVFARHYLLFGLAGMIGALIFIESGFRRRLTRLISSLAVGLAMVSAFVLIFEFFWPIVVALVLLAGTYIIWENFREIKG